MDICFRGRRDAASEGHTVPKTPMHAEVLHIADEPQDLPLGRGLFEGSPCNCDANDDNADTTLRLA